MQNEEEEKTQMSLHAPSQCSGLMSERSLALEDLREISGRAPVRRLHVPTEEAFELSWGAVEGTVQPEIGKLSKPCAPQLCDRAARQRQGILESWPRKPSHARGISVETGHMPFNTCQWALHG